VSEDHVVDPVHLAATGPEVIRAALRLVASAPSADRFPDDQNDLVKLIASASGEDDGVGFRMQLEDGSELPRYQGFGHLWVAPANGALRLRAELGPLQALTAYVWPDGRLSEQTVEEGFPVSEAELTQQARDDIEAVERDQRERAELDAEYERTRFRGENLLRTLEPPWQDPAQLVITAVQLYGDGLIVSYVLPRPDDVAPAPDDDDELFEAALPALEVRDDAGTVYRQADVDVDDLTGPVLRASQTFQPEIRETARCLIVKSPAGSVEIALEAEPR
jgi:hypothetical protein